MADVLFEVPDFGEDDLGASSIGLWVPYWEGPVTLDLDVTGDFDVTVTQVFRNAETRGAWDDDTADVLFSGTDITPAQGTQNVSLPQSATDVDSMLIVELTMVSGVFNRAIVYDNGGGARKQFNQAGGVKRTYPVVRTV